MHAMTILKIFALSQGLTFGALAGAILSVFSLPITRDFFPLALLVATLACAGVGLVTAALRMQRKRAYS